MERQTLMFNIQMQPGGGCGSHEARWRPALLGEGGPALLGGGGSLSVVGVAGCCCGVGGPEVISMSSIHDNCNSHIQL